MYKIIATQLFVTFKRTAFGISESEEGVKKFTTPTPTGAPGYKTSTAADAFQRIGESTLATHHKSLKNTVNLYKRLP